MGGEDTGNLGGVKGLQDLGKEQKWQNPRVKSHLSASQCYPGPRRLPWLDSAYTCLRVLPMRGNKRMRPTQLLQTPREMEHALK